MSLYILALETSGSRCGVALLHRHAGTIEYYVREHDGVAEHSARLLPMVDEVLAEAGLDRRRLTAVAFGQGPGGFTGLRVACGVAQGVGFALGIPVLPIVSNRAVESLLPAHAPALRVIALDARMQEAYLAVYRRGTTVHELQAPVLIARDDVAPWLRRQLPQWLPDAPAWDDLPGNALLIAGDAFASDEQAPDPLLARFIRPGVLRPDVRAVAQLGLRDWDDGLALAADEARPLYVRDKVAFTTREREQGAGGNPRAGG